MKVYEKPMLTVLSLDGNDRLCGSCSEEIRKSQEAGNDIVGILLYQDPNSWDAGIIDEVAGNDDGTITREEAATLFANGECLNGLDDYCKFTSTGKVVAWS